MDEIERLKEVVAHLNDECRMLNDDLTRKEALLERVVSTMEKQAQLITRLLDKITFKP